MLYAALGKVRPGTQQQRTVLRLDWDYPEGVKVMGEYWLETPDPAVVVFFGAEHIGQIWTALAGWDEFIEFTVVPAIEAKDGLALLRKMNPP